MKRVLCALVAGLFCLAGSPFAAAATNSSKKAASKPAASKSAVKAPAKKASKKTNPNSPAKPSSGVAAMEGCRVQKTRTAKGWTSKKVCSGPVEKTLSSPITENALDKPAAAAGADTEVKARSAPDRAYAVDGDTFFYQGRKYKVAGLQGDSSDMAKQRLQKQLESGSLMIDPLSTDSSGTSTATVRINGRNIADRLDAPN